LEDLHRLHTHTHRERADTDDRSEVADVLSLAPGVVEACVYRIHQFPFQVCCVFVT
jgi:hypothetical protein